MVLTFIKVRFDVVGFHHYPNAPEDVAYLRSSHRHVFQFTVSAEVKEDDREIEFHTLKRNLLRFFKGGSEVEFGAKSCEMIASSVMDYLVQCYGKERFYEVEVSEDGECAGVVTYQPEE